MSTILIVGGGVVGQATGAGLRAHGHAVHFYDIDADTSSELAHKGYSIAHADVHENESFDFIFICVPTPYRPETGIDLASLSDALSWVGRVLRVSEGYTVVAIRSTVPVGTVSETARRTLEESSGKHAGEDFGLCVNPEYLREHSAHADFAQPRRLIIGCDEERSGRALAELYAPFGAPISLLRTKEAEAHKYLHNALNATKISFFNEARMACRLMGVDAEAIFPLVVDTAEAIWNPDYGIRDLGPFAGNCLPKDAAGFIRHMDERFDVRMPLLEAVLEVNDGVRLAERRDSPLPPEGGATPARLDAKA